MSKKRRELEAEIKRLQVELELLKCRSYVQGHLLNGSTCNLDNDEHKWHRTTVTYNAIGAVYLVDMKWRTRIQESEIDDE